MAGADEDISEVTDAARLRAEVTKARRERDNNKVLYRGQCPDFDDVESYEIWQRKWSFWRNATSLTERQQAQETISRIRNDHKIKPGLSDLLFRTLTEDQLSNPSCSDLKTFLDEQFNVDEYGDIWELFKTFMNCEIKPGERIQDFTLRFDSAYKALIRKDPNSSMSERVKAMMVRHAAKLETTALMSIRANVRWKKQDGTANGEVYKETIQAMNEICAGNKFKAPSVHQVKLVTAGGTREVQYDGVCLYMDGEQMMPFQQHEMLMTQAKKPVRQRKKKAGEKAGEKTGQDFTEKLTEKEKERLKGIKCFGCQKFGHYKSNCPDQKDGEEHENHIVTEAYDEDIGGFTTSWGVGYTLAVEESFGLSEEEMEQIMEARRREEEEDFEPLRPAKSYDNGGGPAMVGNLAGGAQVQVTISHDVAESNSTFAGHLPILCSDDTDTEEDDNVFEEWTALELIDDYEDGDQQEVFVDTDRLTAKTFTSEADGSAGMDSCCTRTIMGKVWYDSFRSKLSKELDKLVKGPFKSKTNFLFGNGGRKDSLGRYHLPLDLHGCRAIMAVELVDSDIPLLISKPSMTRAGIVLDFCQGTTTVFGIKRNMVETSIGHPIIRVLPEGEKEEFQDVVLVTMADGTEPEDRQILTLPETKKWAPVSWEDQKKIIHKVHRQVGHHSKKKMLSLLRNSTIKWDQKKMMVELDKMLENCEGCILKKRAPCKPAASIPLADGFNQVVGIDLKVYGDGLVILYVIDFWSKLIQARVVKSKKSEDIITALLECWVAHYGCFRATVHDNGGEFVNKAFTEMTDLLGIEDKTGAAHSPWSYGIVEKHHAVVDKTFEALKRDYPHYSDSTLLQWAVTIKNSTTTAAGWSPFQVVFGKNPVLPSLLEANPASMKDEVLSKSLEENFNTMNAARIRYNQALADHQLKRMLKAKLRRNQTVFQQGDFVYWKDNSRNREEWRQGKVLAEDGKLLFIKTGGELYRVHTDMTIRKNEEFDKNGKLITPVEVLRTEAMRAEEAKERKKHSRRRELQLSLDETDRLEDQEIEANIVLEDDTFEDEDDTGDREEPESEEAAEVERQSGDLEGDTGTPSVQNYDDQVGQVLPGTGGEISQVSRNDILLSPANSNHSEETIDTELDTRPNETERTVRDEETETLSAQNYDDPGGQVLPGAGREPPQVSRTNTDLNPANSRNPEDLTDGRSSREARAIMVRQEIQEAGLRRSSRQAKRKAEAAEEISPKPRVKRRNQAAPARPAKPKSTGEKINFPDNSIIYHGGKACQVMGRAATARGGYYNYFNLQPVDGSRAYSVDLQRSEYSMDVDGEQQALITMEVDQNGQQHEVFMETIPYNLHGNQECVQAKMEELDKIVNQFKAVKVVDDVGQFKISTRFVLWYKKHSSGEVQVRARLVCRGYEEQDWVPSDSPTLDQVNLKLILLIAQAEKMNVVSADVKGAFLQGLPLTERTVTVIPPPEAKVPKGKTWQLVVALYGLDDASLRFHWKVRQVMAKLGMTQSRLDPALFFMKDKKGKLLGMIGTHVDDFIMAGRDSWLSSITEKIKAEFLLGTMEKENFLYCGHRIKQQGASLTLDQEEFANTIKPMLISPERKRQGALEVTEAERSMIRAYAGKLGWLGRTTRPDLLVPQIKASSAVTRATVSDLKELAKAVSRVPGTSNVLNIPSLTKDVEKWRLQVYTDAAWQNLEETGSTGGKVVVVTDGNKYFPVTWSANRIRRVCHSSMQAELMAANEGLKDGQYVKELLAEVTGSFVAMELITDNKNAHALIQATTAPQDKRVRCEAASLREAYLTKEVEDIKLVSGKTGQLADCLTKLQADSSSLLTMVQTSKETGLGRD